jgi:hypothetical protein
MSALEKVTACIDSHTLAHPTANVGNNFLRKRRKGSEDIANAMELLQENLFITKADTVHGPTFIGQRDMMEVSKVVKLLLFTTLESLHIILDCVKSSKD